MDKTIVYFFRSKHVIPVSFIVKSTNDKNKNQYISGQEYKKITNFEIIPKTSKNVSKI